MNVKILVVDAYLDILIYDFSLELVVYACVDIGVNALSVHVLNLCFSLIGFIDLKHVALCALNPKGSPDVVFLHFLYIFLYILMKKIILVSWVIVLGQK